MEEEPSELEVVCIGARKLIAEREVLCLKAELKEEGEGLQFHVECEEADQDNMYDSLQAFRKHPSKLEESIEEDEEITDFTYVHEESAASLKGVNLTETTQRNQTAKAYDRDETLPFGRSSVRVADMSEEEWGAFLENFQVLLQSAFHDRKCLATKQRQKQKQRLGIA
ncbi:hypothetical protein BHE74_00005559 [Ensete ventricosum]|nr:hypothetical protein BHE74_00005559 [Ensete ventricosum]RZR89753.1 hypothetical protein BHM03_00017532 [Ensete ventricosum]